MFKSPQISRLIDWFLFIYFLTHIPITLLIDGQVLFHEYYPPLLQSVFNFWCHNFDRLLLERPMWLKVMVAVELVCQLPLFPLLAALFYRGIDKRPLQLFSRMHWIVVLYGAHTCTTLIPIMGSIWFDQKYTPESSFVAAVLSVSYLVYFICPLLAVVRVMQAHQAQSSFNLLKSIKYM